MKLEERLSSGIEGLDEILHGGFLPSRSYLLSGAPGSGKTTIGWHFLAEAIRAGERALFITFGETETELRANAARSGFDVADVTFLDLSPSASIFTQADSYDVFHASEVEREPTVRRIVDVIERIAPQRVFVDSMSHLRYLSTDHTQYRRQTLAFMRYLAATGAAVLVTSESSATQPDDDLRYLVDGVIEIGNSARSRTISVPKFRGSGASPGEHSLVLTANGARVFPRLIPEAHRQAYPEEQLTSGIPRIDEMLQGGIERGTIALITGPSGVGKTSLAVQFMKEAASRGERTAIYTFDERRETLLRRAEMTSTPVREMVANGALSVTEVEALRYGPDEFANLVRRDIETFGSTMVMIDSVSGYRLSVSGDELPARLHALCKYLQNVGVTTILVNELQEIDSFRITDTNISYLADTVIYLRYLEDARTTFARLDRGVGILKKRLSDFDKRLFQYAITSEGVIVGEPLPSLGGILKSARFT